NDHSERDGRHPDLTGAHPSFDRYVVSFAGPNAAAARPPTTTAVCQALRIGFLTVKVPLTQPKTGRSSSNGPARTPKRLRATASARTFACAGDGSPCAVCATVITGDELAISFTPVLRGMAAER